MKIYTKTGDEGKTSLFGGSRVDKHHPCIEAYGTVDELNSWIGLLRDNNINPQYKRVLIEIQDRLFTIGTILAADPEKPKLNKPELLENDVLFLENEIDLMNDALPEMKNFILPGGHLVVSYCHIARCVCRRAERRTIKLSVSYPVLPITVVYLNRLSDYLFVLGRKVAQDFSTEEIPWIPRA